MEIKRYFQKTKWVIAFISFIGLILILSGELLHYGTKSIFWSSLFLHIGMAFIISGIIGIFLELTEIKEFFEKRLAAIIFSNEFIELLSESKIIQFILHGIVGLGKKRTNNDFPSYVHFGKTLCDDILDCIGKPYRQDYFETIDCRILKKEELSEIDDNLRSTEHDVTKIVCTTRYKLVSPNPNIEEKYVLNYFYHVFAIPSINPQKQLTFEVSLGGEKLDLNSNNIISYNNEMVSIKFHKEITFSSCLEISIKVTSIECQCDGVYGRIMVDLTHGINIHFSSPDELKIDCTIYGLSKQFYQPSITKNSAAIQYPGWALPGHGYVIMWKQFR